MRTTIVGGGPGGLYTAILLRKADPSHDVTVLERNRLDDTFGFGVVLSDATRETLEALDPETFGRIEAASAHWDDIEIHYRGEVLRSTGHGFSGVSRQVLLDILARRARDLGATLAFQNDIRSLSDLPAADLVVAADGANSTVRALLEKDVRPTIELRPNRFVWLGTTYPFPAFTFHFKENEHGLWRVHAYRYEEGMSTFIVEATEATWRKAGMDKASEDDTIAYCQRLFAKELSGHALVKNKSLWRQFPIVKCARWSSGNVALLGDAAHTTHFSIGSGTKLAMEDAQALVAAVTRHPDEVGKALEDYEATRRPTVDSFQRAAAVSLTWFEDTERYMRHEPIQFGFSLLTRSFRVTHDELARRDKAYVAAVDRWFAQRAAAQSGVAVPLDPPPPPLFTPFKVRDVVLDNRVVVSPMCMYSATDGAINDWHLVHLGSRAVGGAGLVLAEMTDVSPEARITPGCAGLYKDEHVAAWKRVVDFAHTWTRAKMGIQLGHAGRKGSTCLPWGGGMDEPLPDGNWPILAPSALPYFPHSQVPREMTREDMDKTTEDFVAAARRAERAGFDWLEMHYAHGYLMATFLSPLTNKRTDEYGGSIENRARFPLEVFDAVRRVWPQSKPMSVRISATDWAPGGNDATEAVAIARLFKEHGCDVMDMSAGQTVPHGKPVYGRQFQTPFAERVRLEAGIPTMAVGNISSYTDVNTILAAGRA
ncbi:MAG TPA: FAD-dependent monooxygenase, partial [Candidatus Thermoplasmatota archaeon]|nr:FAD-dependent monooxygenase [Candidatus Thermoplasmatota archaeon]